MTRLPVKTLEMIMVVIGMIAMNLAAASTANAAPRSGEPCSILATGGLYGGSQGVRVNGACRQAGQGDGNNAAPPTKTVACGRPESARDQKWNIGCGTPRACLKTDMATGKPIQVDAFATLTKVGNRWANPVVWCPANAQPAVTMAAVRQQALRLLPHVKIGSAWTTTALVNAETILWADTGADRQLGRVTIVGQRVGLRISLDHASWYFGDGITDTVSTPGKSYDSAGDPCRTAQCPDYYGHTYQRTGPMTITLAVTWHAQFSLDATQWTDIDGAITGPTDQHRIAVKEARGVLVPNPGQH